MKKIYTKSIKGKCSICECELKNGGYIFFESDNTISKLLCPVCDEFKEETRTKNKKLKVKKYYGL